MYVHPYVASWLISKPSHILDTVLLVSHTMSSSSTSIMDLKNRALCYTLRNPPPGIGKTPYATIIENKLVKKTDGTVPSIGIVTLIYGVDIQTLINLHLRISSLLDTLPNLGQAANDKRVRISTTHNSTNQFPQPSCRHMAGCSP